MEFRPVLTNARVLLGVTGGIAAYKTPELVRALTARGARVSVLLTRTARRFVTVDALKAVTRGPVLSGLFEKEALGPGPWFEGAPPSPLGMAHIGLAREADLFLVAPATANAIGKLAHGLADDLLSTALLATRAPLLMAPAMNVAMWEHPAVEANVRTLTARGVRFVGPESGELADGEHGMGRMAALDVIVDACAAALGHAGASRNGGPLGGKTIVITAGGTEEPIDPVRVISNRSSGKMGMALAEEAHRLGARVRLILARTTETAPAGVERVEARTAAAMRDAVLAAMPDADALIMAAAVTDFAPAAPREEKIPRGNGAITLELRPTEDILAQVRERFPKMHLVGFALETQNEMARGREKMKKKGLDLVAINNPLAPGSAFGSDQNDVTLIGADGLPEALGLRPKREVARAILARVAASLKR
ncbi:MAG TPA: bifunctional phosphopantothenoylcysteine decarboxylase/phosphopantothenate--cysteine ligase CoaBC [Candidatus Limnocylindrales bacterium]|nr:bifunctional phosphopantothenoylcysteine decarboxylase/phosphopantothenate--cysteine ligase CoaBC [Candidatus Limnocylindrales bacterium]